MIFIDKSVKTITIFFIRYRFSYHKNIVPSPHHGAFVPRSMLHRRNYTYSHRINLVPVELLSRTSLRKTSFAVLSKRNAISHAMQLQRKKRAKSYSSMLACEARLSKCLAKDFSDIRVHQILSWFHVVFSLTLVNILRHLVKEEITNI